MVDIKELSDCRYGISSRTLEDVEKGKVLQSFGLLWHSPTRTYCEPNGRKIISIYAVDRYTPTELHDRMTALGVKELIQVNQPAVLKFLAQWAKEAACMTARTT